MCQPLLPFHTAMSLADQMYLRHHLEPTDIYSVYISKVYATGTLLSSILFFIPSEVAVISPSRSDYQNRYQRRLNLLHIIKELKNNNKLDEEGLLVL